MVVGDIMLDRYMWGTVERVSPEAPVPVVRLKETSAAAGGAANVAANIASLGAKPILVGIVGDDIDADELRRVLRSSNVDDSTLLTVSGRPTTVKSRIVAHGQQVVRVDHELTDPLARDAEIMAISKLEPLIDAADAIVISDYAKGFLTDKILSMLIGSAKRSGKKILVDPKGKNYLKYSRASIITPNKREAAEACGLETCDPELIENSGNRLLGELDCSAVLITRGEEGMSLVENGGEWLHLPTTARQVYDVTGAGDTVIAAMAVSLAAGFGYQDSARLANMAAGVVVSQVGTTAIDARQLQKAIDSAERTHSVSEQ